MLEKDIQERAENIELLLLDVDGVLTDGRLIMGTDGSEAKAFHARDGLGIRLAQRGGIMIGLISGRESSVVSDRAEELYITEVHQRVFDKLERFNEILDRLNLTPDKVCFMGDDLVDLPVMRVVGLSAAPADALPEVLEDADYVAKKNGGAGCVREIVDLLLKARGKWESVTARFAEEK